MDVVNLLTAIDDGGNPTEDRACVIADDLDTLVSGTKNHVAIYFVFTEKLTLRQPFKLMLYNSQQDVTRLPASFALKQGLPMWNMTDRSSPQSERYPDDYIKLDFFKPSRGEDEGRIVYTFTDVNRSTEKNPMPEGARVLKSPRKFNMKLYVTFPLADTDVHVLSEKSMASFIAMKGRRLEVPLNRIECRISLVHCLSSMLSFPCGRCVCQCCWDKNLAISKSTTEDKCIYCRSNSCKKEAVIRLKLRQGPCPIDMCSQDGNVLGVVLIPCGCHILCDRLRKKADDCNGNYDSLIKKIPFCPYDACKKIVRTFRVIND
ncbi:unnamed protein product [Caenorhabditis brenneri]